MARRYLEQRRAIDWMRDRLSRGCVCVCVSRVTTARYGRLRVGVLPNRPMLRGRDDQRLEWIATASSSSSCSPRTKSPKELERLTSLLQALGLVFSTQCPAQHAVPPTPTLPRDHRSELGGSAENVCWEERLAG
jgi:hypothetical protein